jgi:hypothetical protein
MQQERKPLEMKKQSETFKLYEMDGQFIPASFRNYKDRNLYSYMKQSGAIDIESASYELILDFKNAYNNKDRAIEAAQNKWGKEINLDSVKGPKFLRGSR